MFMKQFQVMFQVGVRPLPPCALVALFSSRSLALSLSRCLLTFSLVLTCSLSKHRQQFDYSGEHISALLMVCVLNSSSDPDLAHITPYFISLLASKEKLHSHPQSQYALHNVPFA
jgi:hypothetical protein